MSYQVFITYISLSSPKIHELRVKVIHEETVLIKEVCYNQHAPTDIFL